MSDEELDHDAEVLAPDVAEAIDTLLAYSHETEVDAWQLACWFRAHRQYRDTRTGKPAVGIPTGYDLAAIATYLERLAVALRLPDRASWAAVVGENTYHVQQFIEALGDRYGHLREELLDEDVVEKLRRLREQRD